MSEPIRPIAGLFVLFLALTAAAGCASTAETAETTPPDTTRTVVPREVPTTVPARGPARRVPGVDLDTVRAGRFDQGKMWTFDHPPVEYFAETYDVSPDEAWFERARLGALRIPGCTASFVSPNGLVLTNHHCGRDEATSVSREGENILDNGFYAASLDEERQVEEMWADQLIEIRDVTEEVDVAVAEAQTDAERAQARADAIDAIEERISAERGDDYLVQVISLYNGGRYSAYVFRHYTDVRLVMIPELELGFFGGDPDNFTYPRYTLDMSLFRVYENGRPLQSENYFPVSEEGVEEGDAVFVVGNPGSTFRLSTIAELEFKRDVEEPGILHFYETRLAALEDQLASTTGEDPDELRNLVFSLQNARKLFTGRVAGLNDPIITARRRDTERQFLEAIEEDSTLREQYGDLVDQMRRLQEQKREYANEFRAFLALQPQSSLGAAVLRRALVAREYLTQQSQGASGDRLQTVLQALDAVEDQAEELQERLLAQRFEDFVLYFGEDSPLVQDVLQGRSPEAAAEYVVANSALVTAESTESALESGNLTMDDPAVQVASALSERLSAFRSAFAGLSAQEQEIAGKLGRARFEIYGTDVPPDATFSLRIADGVVKGYPYNGTIAPPYTTYYGVYDHYYSYGPDTPWDLPERWLTPPEEFDLETPLNFVSTNDIIGGNSGSPAINTDHELVGLIFDGNIESLPGDFIYMTDRARSISVDSRGILEALGDMYDADRLVIEATTGRMFDTEEEADASLAE